MAEHTRRLDISGDPGLLRLAEEVRRSKEPRVLGRGSEDLALVVPLSSNPGPSDEPPTAADYESLRMAVGSWSDIDTVALKKYLYRAREEGTRPNDRP